MGTSSHFSYTFVGCIWQFPRHFFHTCHRLAFCVNFALTMQDTSPNFLSIFFETCPQMALCLISGTKCGMLFPNSSFFSLTYYRLGIFHLYKSILGTLLLINYLYIRTYIFWTKYKKLNDFAQLQGSVKILNLSL